MGKGKLAKFAENETFVRLVQPSADSVLKEDDPIKGKWNDSMFAGTLGGREAPIVVELGCGKGEYTIDLAVRESGKNYIGVDIKGARLWRGAKTATERNMSNVAFLRTRIEFINSLFAPGEISEIWITFCDPQPAKPSKRLTSPAFLDRYRKFLKPGGIVHLKTDCRELFLYTLSVVREQGLELLASTDNLYGSAVIDAPSRYPSYAGIDNLPDGPLALDSELLEKPELRQVQTHYEKMFLEQGLPITYLAFRLK